MRGPCCELRSRSKFGLTILNTSGAGTSAPMGDSRAVLAATYGTTRYAYTSSARFARPLPKTSLTIYAPRPTYTSRLVHSTLAVSPRGRDALGANPLDQAVERDEAEVLVLVARAERNAALLRLALTDDRQIWQPHVPRVADLRP